MNKKLKSQLKIAFDAPKPTAKNAFLQSINYPEASRFDFVLSQIGYIRKRVWVISLLFFISALLGLYFYKNTFSVIWIISCFIPFIALVTITEVARSSSFNMAELEMSCKHSFAEVILVRLEILGSFNFVIFALLIMFLVGKSNYSILRLAIYILTPFLLTCTLSLFTINHTHSRETIYICGGISSFVSLFYIILTKQYYKIFEESYVIFWNILFIILLILLVKETVNLIRRMEELQWNLLSIV